MFIFLYSAMEAILLVIAVSTDTFLASFSYGVNKIRIPFASVLIINIICTSVLALSVFLGSIIGPLIPSQITTAICFSILLVLGILKLFDSSIKSLIRKHEGLNKEIKFSMFNLNFILNIYADPQKADSDYSRVLSSLEATSLAVALSLDGLGAGFGAGLVAVNLIEVVLFSLILGIVSVITGCYIGNKIAKKLTINLSWLSGILLIVFGILTLIY